MRDDRLFVVVFDVDVMLELVLAREILGAHETRVLAFVGVTERDVIVESIGTSERSITERTTMSFFGLAIRPVQRRVRIVVHTATCRISCVVVVVIVVGLIRGIVIILGGYTVDC